MTKKSGNLTRAALMLLIVSTVTLFGVITLELTLTSASYLFIHDEDGWDYYSDSAEEGHDSDRVCAPYYPHIYE